LSARFVLDQKSKAMRESIIYSGIKNQQVNLPLGVIRVYKKGQFIFKEAASVFKIYKLKKGLIMMAGSLKGSQSSFTHFVQEGEFFGIESLLDLERRGHSAQVLSDTVQIEEYSTSEMVDGKQAQKIVKENFVKHTTRVQRTLMRNSRLNLRSRLIEVLKEIGQGMGVMLLNGEVLIRTHLKHRELAFLCNATRQSITTQLIELNKRNYVNIDKNSILLTKQLLTND
jgi:CRP/FNR family cyclic AMP-dependent transcriptional regulator